MRRAHKYTWLLTALIAAPGAVVAAPATAAEPEAPLAVEGFAYPDAAKILTDQGVTLKTGDGNVTLVDCASATGLLRVRSTPQRETCFKATGATGYVSMEVAGAYAIMIDNRTVKATLSTDGTSTSVDLTHKNGWNEVGTGNNQSEAVLLDLAATDGTPVTLPAPEFPAVGSIAIGQAGRAGSRGCTATLVDPKWVLTSAGCFTDTPATLTAGAPAAKSTFTLGSHVSEIVRLAPRTDRDLVMAFLSTPIYDVAPAKLATTAATSGAAVKVAGFGRTATTWGTGHGPRTADQNVTAVTASGLALDAVSSTSAPVCAGDAGAPVLNAAGDIDAVVSRAQQGRCLGTPATRTGTGASADRVDDLGAWVTSTIATSPKRAGSESGGTGRVRYADWDGDGRADLLTVADSGAVHVYLNRGGDGNGGWQDGGQVASGVTKDMSRVRFADWDGDGKADYIVIQLSGAVGVFLNRGGDGHGGWQDWGQVASGVTSDLTRIRFADIDGDGKADYDIVNTDGSVTAYINKGGDGHDGWSIRSKITNGATTNQNLVHFADLTGEGNADYLLIDGTTRAYAYNGGDDLGGAWINLGQIAGAL
ncbi:FG-GAP-like repeat-containing protein [Kitasatospora phosalacinea]|uniref:FG-GAP-like repeat-containing protein n=1 Tax=Kitasatospora phosalacinea TaxID=2065 RepID=UPI00365D112B